MEDGLPVRDISIWEKYKIPFILGSVGLVFLIIGLRFILWRPQPSIQFVEESINSTDDNSKITVDVAGAVEKPGIYTLPATSRIQDALLAAGGLALDADRDWVAKYINLAAKLIDATKIYIPTQNEITQNISTSDTLGVISGESSTSSININSASATELDSLPGVGMVTAQKIIDNRPFTTLDELLSKKVVNQSTFNKIKDRISLY